MFRFALTLVLSLIVVISLKATARGQMASLPSDRPIVSSVDFMDTQNFSLLDYRRMFRSGSTPTSEEMIGSWRGVNKGIVQLVGYGQFIKEIVPSGCIVMGDNIKVNQVSQDMLNVLGWQPKIDERGQLERQGKFVVLPPRGLGAFKHGAVISYARGGNRRTDPVRLLVDKVVKLDDDHLLGRATAKFGPIQIPVAFFVLERIK